MLFLWCSGCHLRFEILASTAMSQEFPRKIFSYILLPKFAVLTCTSEVHNYSTQQRKQRIYAHNSWLIFSVNRHLHQWFLTGKTRPCRGMSINFKEGTSPLFTFPTRKVESCSLNLPINTFVFTADRLLQIKVQLLREGVVEKRLGTTSLDQRTSDMIISLTWLCLLLLV